ncbi:MBL fold metallo-hydrolase [Pedobacter cryophilus]|uniref:MBL fold metallo-hydrolase n=1 Tax=Pedobacter cryophilus TaxID=2571271 RepID=A0A4U1BUL8_9SPHI|nr:MBL fold metallo-hydrolase [Pedobacter cryophilus]TKB95585.1 MBL fold metallo-hydrolase [Pedobacter cryophilus]
MKRRNFLLGGGLTLSALALGRFTSFASNLDFAAAFNIKMLTDKVGIFTEQGGTIMFMLSKSGIVVVDSQFPDPAKHLIDELKKANEMPFDLLINTHHHGDHSGGNIAFKGLVNHVVAHQNSALNQKRVIEEAIKAGRKVNEQYYPDQVFNKKWKYKIDGEHIKAHYFGAGHTNGDAMIHFEDQNVVHMGDLVFNRRYPFIDRAGGANISSWIKVLDKGMDTFGTKTQYVFGHAFDSEKIVGTRDDVRAFQDYLEKLLAHVSSEIKAGKSKEDIMKTTSIPGVTEWKGDGIGRGIDAAYQELTSK